MSDTAIKIVADISQAQAQVRALENQIKGLGSGANASGLQSQFVRTGQAAQSLASQLQAANNNTSGFGNSLGGLNGVVGRLGGSFGGLSGIVGGFIGGLAVGAISAFIGSIQSLASNIINATAEVEKYKASLTTMLGDTTKAGQAFDLLATFAAKTPFSLQQATEGFLKLKALGLTPSEAALTSYGNTAASMGKNLMQMIEAVADASTGEFERLKEFGIKSKVQGDQVAFTFQGVTTKVGNNSAAIQKYLQDIGNTKFGGAMERQAATIGGAISNLKDNLFQAFASIGQGKLSESIQGFINGLATGIQKVSPLLGAIGSAFGSILSVIGTVASGVFGLWSAFQGGQSSISILDTLTFTFNAVSQTASVVANVIGQGFQMVAGVISWLVDQARSLFGGLFSWLPSFALSSNQSVGNSFIGILRAVKYVALNIPALFKASISAVGDVFGILGSRIVAFFKGNFSAFDGFGGQVQARLAAVGAQAAQIGANASKIMGDVKANDAALDRMLGRKGKTNATLEGLAGPPPKLAPTAGSGKDKKDAAAEQAAKLADQRAKNEENFWQTLKEQAEAAGVLRGEAEKYNKELELRKILNDGDLRKGVELTQAQKARVASLIDEKNQNEIIRSLRERTLDANQRNNDLTRQAALISQLGVEGAADQLELESKLADIRKQALEKGVDLQSASVAAALREAEAAERTNVALARKVELLKGGLDQYSQYSPLAAQASTLAKIEKDRAGLDRAYADPDARAALGLTKEVYDSIVNGMKQAGTVASRSLANKFMTDMAYAIDQIGDAFGGKFGGILQKIGSVIDKMNAAANGDFSRGGLLGGVTNLLTTLGVKDKAGNSFGTLVQGGANGFNQQWTKALANPIKSLGDGFSSFKSAFSPANGGFVAGLGKAIGGAMQGAAIGQAVAGVGKAVWSKFSNTGSQIGGALGSAFGPIGSVVGSVLGGITGGLLKKSPKANASIGFDAYGNLSLQGLTGNSKKAKAALSGFGDTIVKGIYDIASRLGGDVSGAPSLALKVKNDKYTVNGQKFGKDTQAAAQFGIQEALKQGVISGISRLSKTLIAGAGSNIDSAVAAAESWEKVLADLANMENPVKGAVESVTKGLDRLTDTLRKNGATSDELATLERYRALKIKSILEEQLSGFNDFKKSLFGEGSGVTGLSRLNSDLAQFNQLRADIAGGKAVDQSVFTGLGQEIFSIARDLYGQANPEFQSIRAMLIEATQGAIDNTTNQFNDATVVAIQTQTDQITAQQAVTNDYLNQILQAVQKGNIGAGVGLAFGGAGAINGSVVNRY